MRPQLRQENHKIRWGKNKVRPQRKQENSKIRWGESKKAETVRSSYRNGKTLIK